jgi:phosphoribosylaminoimidazole carboxylase PurE protein
MSTSMVRQIGIVMGSRSDWPIMEEAAKVLLTFNIPYEIAIVSAHRTPEHLFRYATTGEERGLRVIIAGAGGAAHLPGMIAALTPLMVIGVPIETKILKGLDSLLSIVQMPHGVPVLTVGINQAGNAALAALQLLSETNLDLRARFRDYRQEQCNESLAHNKDLQSKNES